MKSKNNNDELIQLSIDPIIKEKAQKIFNEAGINISTAVTMFLTQIVNKKELPSSDEFNQINETEYEKLAEIIESTGGNGKVNKRNKKILHLYSTNDIDYETAVFALKRSFINNE